MLFSSPGRGFGKRPRTAPLTAGGLQAAVLASLVVASTCLTGSHNLCPRHLDCARAGRHLCLPPDSHCGSCLSPLVENSHGKCMVKRRIHAAPHVGKETTYPELDEEIDFLSTIIGEQRETARIAAPPPKPEKEEALAPSPVQRSTTHSPPPNSTTPASTTNLTAVRLSNPKTLPHPANDYVFVVMSGVFVAAACLAFTITGVCWVRLQKGVRLAQKVDYPAYGLMAAHSYDNNVPGDKKLPHHSAQVYHHEHPGDKKLAHSAQMYHYQHQKQQMLSLEKQRDEPKVSDSGATSDEENEDGDFTVYECPGLAPTGEMEVKNPLFDDSTLYHQRFHK